MRDSWTCWRSPPGSTRLFLHPDFAGGFVEAWKVPSVRRLCQIPKRQRRVAVRAWFCAAVRWVRRHLSQACRRASESPTLFGLRLDAIRHEILTDLWGVVKEIVPPRSPWGTMTRACPIMKISTRWTSSVKATALGRRTVWLPLQVKDPRTGHGPPRLLVIANRDIHNLCRSGIQGCCRIAPCFPLYWHHARAVHFDNSALIAKARSGGGCAAVIQIPSWCDGGLAADWRVRAEPGHPEGAVG